MTYIPLNVSSAYSFLSSSIKISEYIKAAKKNGFKAIGISDFNCAFSFPSFVKECNTNSIIPILGIELKIEYKNNERTINLFIQNEEGYNNLCEILNKLNNKNINTLFENTNGLICIIPSINGNWFNYPFDFQNQREFLYDIQKHFKSFYIGTECYSKDDISYLNEIYAFADESNYKTVAFPKTISLNKNDGLTIEMLNCIKNNSTIENIEEKNTPYFLLNEKAVKKIYRKEDFIFFDEEKFSFNLFNKRGRILSNKTIENKKNDLFEQCLLGLKKKCITIDDKIVQRLEYELNIIEKMNYLDYFYIVKEYVNYAKNNNISVGPGRGSAAGSLVTYALNITEINPFEYNLLFERFLNPERVSMPDIDIDFSDKKRELIISHITSKYGKDKVKNIITFQTIGPKQAIRDVGRIFNFNTTDINILCKSIGNNTSFKDAYLNSSSFKKLIENEHYKKIASLARKIEGFPRQKGLHAAGIIINDEPLYKSLPIIGDENAPVPFEAPFLEEMNYLKMDILGLRNLSIIEDIISLIKNDLNINIDLLQIPLDDKKTFDILNKGLTKGIFQLESDGITNSIKKINIESFNDLIALNALYRPGPMENISLYAKRKKGLEKTTYIDNRLEPILKDTYGIIVYQEQIMQIAQVIAGFSLGKADLLRRAISKKDENKLKKLESDFINGAINNGLDLNKAKTIYNYIYKFADYGFNKSHSVSYSYIAYQMAYLKANYPTYFYAVMFEYQKNSSQKYSLFYNELDYFNIKILTPDINKSHKHYSIENNLIRLPLSSIISFSSNNEDLILEERKNGNFIDFKDTINRLIKINIDEKSIKLLINAGALDFTNISRKTMRNNLDKLIQFAQTINANNSFTNDELIFLEPRITYFESDKYEDFQNEINSIGILLSGSLFEKYNDFIKKYKTTSISDALKFSNNEHLILPLVITSIRIIETKKSKKMAILECIDDSNTIKVLIFPNDLNIINNINENDYVLINGHISKDNYGTSFIAKNIIKMEVI